MTEQTFVQVLGCRGDVCESQCYLPQAGVKGRTRAGSGMAATRKATMWQANVRSDGFVKCAEGCGTDLTYGEAQIAHIVADANGGAFCANNLVLTCKRCNDRRGDTDMVYGDVRADWQDAEFCGEAKGKRLHRQYNG